MTIAVQIRTDEIEWDALGGSTIWKRSSAHAAVPDSELARALLQRLVARSTAVNGFDRATLLRLDTEAWGAVTD
jgi:hypothetical protein